MPSPFPGMDPWLEHPALWPDVHANLIVTIQGLLNPVIRPAYVARVEERIYLETDGGPGTNHPAVPDLRIARRVGGGPPVGGGLAVAEALELDNVTEFEVRELRVEIIATDNRQVVTVVELLSPTSKARGTNGWELFTRKRMEVMNSPANWVDIDLLRAGTGWGFRRKLEPHDYLAYASEAARRPRGRAWPMKLTERLPVIGVPLRDPHPPAPLDLQAALDLAYDRASYDLTVDYTKPPDPPLTADQQAWADAVLAERR